MPYHVGVSHRKAVDEVDGPSKQKILLSAVLSGGFCFSIDVTIAALVRLKIVANFDAYQLNMHVSQHWHWVQPVHQN